MRFPVNLLIGVEADTPQEAVFNFIEALTGNGLRGWSYQVFDDETHEEIGIFNGYGVLQLPEEPSEDQELITLAEELSAEEN